MLLYTRKLQQGAKIEKKPSTLLKSYIIQKEEALDNYLGHPNKAATDMAFDDYEAGEIELNETDPVRHMNAARLSSKAIKDKTGNIPILSKVAGYIASNYLGLGHEVLGIVRSPYATTVIESAEDLGNNLIGNVVELLPGSDKQKRDRINRLVRKGHSFSGVADD